MEKIFNKNDLFLSFNRPLSKNENIIFKVFIKHIQENGNLDIELSEASLSSMIKLDQDNNFKNFLENFMKKKIIYKYSKFNFFHSEGHMYIISSYRIIDRKFIISFSNDFFNIFNKDLNDFKLYKFHSLLQFNNPLTRNFFMMLMQKDIQNNFIDISLEELKKVLEIDNRYSRFYDFEKHVLIPGIKEIRSISNIEIQYEKLKINNNSKIIGLRIFTKDRLDSQLDREVRLMMDEIGNRTSNPHRIQPFLKKYILSKGADYVKKNIYYSILHAGKKFDLFLIESMKYDYFRRRFKSRIKNFDIPVFFLDKHFDDIAQLRKALFKILKKTEFLHLSNIISVLEDTLDLINQKEDRLIKKFAPFYNEFIVNLENIKECKYDDNIFTIFIEFNGKYDSHIYIFKK